MDIITKIQITDDGSATLYRPDIDEHYHSVKGAVTESLHVYVNCGLIHRIASADPAKELKVLEIGFGTGLNAALSADAAIKSGRRIRYVSLELHPLPFTISSATGYDKLSPYFIPVCSAPWNKIVPLAPQFTIEKRVADFNYCELPNGTDVVFFDAFAPDKQPEMWTAEGFARIYAAMNNGGVLTTYCAKGAVRRELEAIGFIVERIAGPAGGKREILRCTKPL